MRYRHLQQGKETRH